jgi:hypothetical protein
MGRGRDQSALGIEIVRAVNRHGSKLILVSSDQNKFNRIASVVIPQDADTLFGVSPGSAKRPEDHK